MAIEETTATSPDHAVRKNIVLDAAAPLYTGPVFTLHKNATSAVRKHRANADSLYAILDEDGPTAASTGKILEAFEGDQKAALVWMDWAILRGYLDDYAEIMADEQQNVLSFEGLRVRKQLLDHMQFVGMPENQAVEAMLAFEKDAHEQLKEYDAKKAAPNTVVREVEKEPLTALQRNKTIRFAREASNIFYRDELKEADERIGKRMEEVGITWKELLAIGASNGQASDKLMHKLALLQKDPEAFEDFKDLFALRLTIDAYTRELMGVPKDPSDANIDMREELLGTLRDKWEVPGALPLLQQFERDVQAKIDNVRGR